MYLTITKKIPRIVYVGFLISKSGKRAKNSLLNSSVVQRPTPTPICPIWTLRIVHKRVALEKTAVHLSNGHIISNHDALPLLIISTNTTPDLVP